MIPAALVAFENAIARKNTLQWKTGIYQRDLRDKRGLGYVMVVELILGEVGAIGSRRLWTACRTCLFCYDIRVGFTVAIAPPAPHGVDVEVAPTSKLRKCLLAWSSLLRFERHSAVPRSAIRLILIS